MKKRIFLASLQRKQEQEEAKARKEQEAQARREREKAKEEEKARKKEEQIQRRAAILEQYKLKKAMEEAEREGKVFDKSDMMGSLKPTPKMRPKAASRPRPKTIHIDSGSVEMAEGMMQPSRGKKGSTSNLTANSTMKRDYYRGSQDSLADRSMSSGMLYRDSPDDSRGVSPCHSANQTLGRRSSYKTSRGSSTDQDSLAYRYGDTDSGLGRATPPRRAPSPGMGSMRHLTSPSGPGSLPGLMTKGRRIFDDGSSDISSTPSSMMDYTGPRLYKQPATKSNRGIMLNAVEYCVFPGVVNREAKKRVLEEINRSESKHFLILFRDAGCQFRALYSYCPDREEVMKLYGTGPKQVNDRMFDKFFKYNSGGKCFSQVHTKHLTVTIDAFTIHNSLWQGKKVNLPNKKDMPLVI
jgi:calmodulin-regulated spectrin-associated protein